eukprot:scaffold12132_cov103-Isochrysis_galbana.AAC.4
MIGAAARLAGRLGAPWQPRGGRREVEARKAAALSAERKRNPTCISDRRPVARARAAAAADAGGGGSQHTKTESRTLIWPTLATSARRGAPVSGLTRSSATGGTPNRGSVV